MKIPYKWIREFVDLDLTAGQAADRLINAGVEVASVTPLAPELRGVVIGEVEGIERELGDSHGHRLVLCWVRAGRERFSVVCGAPNTAVGLRAAFALPGAALPGGRHVGVAKIRGADSQGMLCSERELGLGDEHERGVLAVEADAPLGADLREYLGLDDEVLEIEITPNRPDCLSVVGMARELSALTGAPFRYPDLALKEGGESVHDLARVRIDAPELCARFTARVISGVTVRPSPARLAWRLRAAGLRPISNVVDVTNYVMWELGHPLHAFDHATVADATIVVRRARTGETLATLDGQERTLAGETLVIADPKRAIGLAGVMGGADTEVTDRTTRILLEAAWFLPGSIRRTARALGLQTDAAYRFERGADIEALVDASGRAAQLIAELAGGTVARGVVDAYPQPRPRPRVTLRMSRVQRVLGVAPPRAEARRILGGLGLVVRDRGEDLEVEVPGARRDLAIEDDLVEEVIRVWGYDKIPSTLPGGAIQVVRLPASLEQTDAVRRALVGAGVSEAITYSFSDPAYEEVWRAAGGPAPLALVNPLSRDASWLRYNPLEGVLGIVATNLRKQQADVRVFEITKTYEPAPGLADERRWLAVALTGARAPLGWWAKGEGGRGEPVDVFDAKGLAELVLEALGTTGLETRATMTAGVKGFEPDCHGTLVTAGGVVVAEFGEVSAEVRRLYDIAAPVFAAVLPLDALLRLTPPPVRYRALPRYPAVHRDLAFVAGALRAVTAAEIEAGLREEAGPLLRQIVLFDVFALDDGGRSLAWRLTFQAEDRTLTDDEVNAIQERVARRTAERFRITWRGV
ncbi:MAG: phenylalanine--tRNA ligase subunit beta [Candidatus Rokubacteria bacterium]|nr:phenylalanine--tRNA ligase subunit beta [Candidatus Rokubacteria bacterium]